MYNLQNRRNKNRRKKDGNIENQEKISTGQQVVDSRESYISTNSDDQSSSTNTGILWISVFGIVLVVFSIGVIFVGEYSRV